MHQLLLLRTALASELFSNDFSNHFSNRYSLHQPYEAPPKTARTRSTMVSRSSEKLPPAYGPGKQTPTPDIRP